MEQTTTTANWNDLGTRVLNAARLAVAMHLAASVRSEAAHRPIVIGGAGPRFVTDDVREEKARMGDRG